MYVGPSYTYGPAPYVGQKARYGYGPLCGTGATQWPSIGPCGLHCRHDRAARALSGWSLVGRALLKQHLRLSRSRTGVLHAEGGIARRGEMVTIDENAAEGRNAVSSRGY